MPDITTPDDRLRQVFEEGLALHRADDFHGAVQRYLQVLAERPNLWFVADNLCQALLAAGDHKAGFALYDNRFHRPRSAVPRPTLSFPEWRGEPLAGRSILVWPEQGFGDQIMFVRFARFLAEAGAEVSLGAYPLLARLFAELTENVVPAGDPSAVPAHDFWISAGSIPGRLGLGSDHIWSGPYLRTRADGAGIGICVAG